LPAIQENSLSSSKYITLKRDKQVATIVLSHPDKPNPLTTALQVELINAIAEVASDASLRALVLSATGPAFCVGADFGEVLEAERNGASIPEWTAGMLQQYTNPIITALRDLPIPVVGAVQGAAAGAGVGLALATDLLLMSDTAYFYLPFVPKLGLIPDMGSSWFLLRQLGRARTMSLALLGDRLPAQEAVDLGLAIECLPSDALMHRANEYANRLALIPKNLVVDLRKFLDATEKNSLETQLKFECLTQLNLLNRGNFKEGIESFLEKRKPRFN
jgi:2-(1,2-epoxy-1,2-dihydrophenyl)acetyl-CoA isomerase